MTAHAMQCMSMTACSALGSLLPPVLIQKAATQLNTCLIPFALDASAARLVTYKSLKM
jgi:hypothetical protein